MLHPLVAAGFDVGNEDAQAIPTIALEAYHVSPTIAPIATQRSLQRRLEQDGGLAGGSQLLDGSRHVFAFEGYDLLASDGHLFSYLALELGPRLLEQWGERLDGEPPPLEHRLLFIGAQAKPEEALAIFQSNVLAQTRGAQTRQMVFYCLLHSACPFLFRFHRLVETVDRSASREIAGS
jgi:hypothetical protein